MADTKAEQLKKCPFCDGKARLTKALSSIRKWKYSVVCNKCLTQINWYNSKAKVITTWNTRADRWISVSERLPELEEGTMQSKWVLATDGKNIVESYYYDYSTREAKSNMATGKGWCRHGMPAYTHWKPITLPKEQER